MHNNFLSISVSTPPHDLGPFVMGPYSIIPANIRQP